MKYKLKYSPNASDILRDIKAQITITQGQAIATSAVAKIMKVIRGLTDNPQKGPSVEALLGISTPYRFLYVNHNYVFYRIDNNTILVTDIYNEQEDFMSKMFGINMRTQESIDFWGE